LSETTEHMPPWAPVPGPDFIRMLFQAGFSPEAYRDRYADLAAMNWNASQALSHFLLQGLHERRIAPMTLNREALVELARLPIEDFAFKARLLTSLSGHLFDDVQHTFGDAIVERWPVIEALMPQGARPYFISGDSHTNQYRLTGVRGAEWLLPIHMLCTGASAAGLGNPDSRSGYGKMLRQMVRVIETLPGIETVPLLLQFGQVDIEFVHHFQRVRDGRLALDLDEYRTFCKRTADQYIKFVNSLSGKLQIVLVSVFPPALSDAAWHKGYVNADIVSREGGRSVAEMSDAIRNLQVATLRQRTEIHLHYNDLLRKACKRLGFGFIDSATPFLGPDGLVDPRYVDAASDGADHHLDERTTHVTIGKLIWQHTDQARGIDQERGNGG
jgi:hypothetical protein